MYYNLASQLAKPIFALIAVDQLNAIFASAQSPDPYCDTADPPICHHLRTHNLVCLLVTEGRE